MMERVERDVNVHSAGTLLFMVENAVAVAQNPICQLRESKIVRKVEIFNSV